MIEAAFPLLGTAFVVLIVLPACALIAKAGLLVLERSETGGPLHGLSLRYVLLTGSSVLPLAWLLSAGVHQAESGRSALACLFDHDAAERCFEPGFFALTLAAVVAWSAFAAKQRHRAPRAGTSKAAVALGARIERIIKRSPQLHRLRDRIVATDDSSVTLGTHGWFLPRIFIGTAFAEQLSEDMLASAFGHEAEHVTAHDPLRYLMLQLALGVNPLGRFLLEPHAGRWLAGREAQCDREAVIHGAAPLPLADAIVRAARPSAGQAVALGAPDIQVLKFRIGMLLAFAERAPLPKPHYGSAVSPLGFLLLFTALLLPHHASTAALDVLHASVEHAFTYVWR